MLKQIKDSQHKKKQSKHRKEIAKVYCDIEIYNGKERREINDCKR